MNCGPEPSPTGVKKLVQVSEEVQKPVHVPVVLGNECFVITQQDMRKIEDVRCISYHKLGPNGELIPIDSTIGQNFALRDAILNAAMFHAQNQGEAACRQLLELLGKCNGRDFNRMPMPTPIKASIAQQMEWSGSPESTPAFPFTYAKATSMDGMPRLKNEQPVCNQACCCACPIKYVTHQGCNTMEDESSTDHHVGQLSARQKLKIRKSLEDTLGV